MKWCWQWKRWHHPNFFAFPWEILLSRQSFNLQQVPPPCFIYHWLDWLFIKIIINNIHTLPWPYLDILRAIVIVCNSLIWRFFSTDRTTTNFRWCMWIRRIWWFITCPITTSFCWSSYSFNAWVWTCLRC